MLSLLDVQRGFRAALLGGDSVAVAALIADDGIEAADRLDVHRNNVISSLSSVLKATFPAVCRLVDERFFGFAAHEFIRTHPPRHPSLAEYGDGFGDFLAGFSPCRDLPYLPDVARLEWRLHKSADAPDSARLALHALRDIPAGDTPRLCFALAASYFYLGSRWPIDRIWHANQRDPGDEINLGSGGAWIEIRRHADAIELRPLPQAIFAFRQRIQAGQTLAEATEGALTCDADFDLNSALVALFADGAVASFFLSVDNGND